jgi:hypothetical protein
VPTGSEAAKVRILTGPQFHAMRLANTGLCWMESTGAEPAYPSGVELLFLHEMQRKRLVLPSGFVVGCRLMMRAWNVWKV